MWPWAVQLTLAARYAEVALELAPEYPAPHLTKASVAFTAEGLLLRGANGYVRGYVGYGSAGSVHGLDEGRSLSVLQVVVGV